MLEGMPQCRHGFTVDSVAQEGIHNFLVGHCTSDASELDGHAEQSVAVGLPDIASGYGRVGRGVPTLEGGQ